jgi:predicted lipoprotein
MKKIFLALVALLVAIFYSCSPEGSDSNTDSYSRSALLANWADNIIVPSMIGYQSKVGALSDAVNNFNAAPDVAKLEVVRQAWLDAYVAYQQAALFTIGKAEDLYFREISNTYPTNSAGIQSNITSGNYDLQAISQFDKQGFPALDYLIHGLGLTDEEIVAAYSSGIHAAQWRGYLSALVTRLKTSADAIVADWNAGYRNTFVNNSGTSVASSVNKMTNNFVKYVEKDIRSAKVGIPAGIFSNGTRFPEKVEAYYKNDASKTLLMASIAAARDFFNGKHYSGTMTGESLKSYLNHINAVRDGQNLSSIIDNQFAAALGGAGGLSNSFSQQVLSDNSKMLAAYDALQQNVVYLKLDMMQALNITIDYVDSDGD